MVFGEMISSEVVGVRQVTQYEWAAVCKEIVHTNRWIETEPDHYESRDGRSAQLHTREVDGYGTEVWAIDIWEDDSLTANRIVPQPSMV